MMSNGISRKMPKGKTGEWKTHPTGGRFRTVESWCGSCERTHPQPEFDPDPCTADADVHERTCYAHRVYVLEEVES